MQTRLLIILFSLLFCCYPAYADSQFVNRPEVKNFIKQMVKKHHFKEARLIALFNAVKVRPQVIQSIRAPLEQRPWHTYERLFVTEWRIREGVIFWNKYRTTLATAEKK
ncbi:MAG TPA: lytic murein transglycosylase, partial [Gammaproteobacteria bacterium]|nr:lytic murein transglycosylase [Gammaproteobacteria bacterium]